MREQTIILKTGLKIHTRISGDLKAPALVLLHGWPSNSMLFRHMVPELSRHFLVLAPDLPGHGRSDKPKTARYDLEFLRGFILDFFDALALEKAHLAVHDLGGMAGLSFAVRHPERLDRLVVMNTSPYPDWSLPLHLSIWLLKQPLLTRFFLNRFIFRQVLKTGFCSPARITPEVLETFRQPWVDPVDGLTAFSRTIAVPPAEMVEPREKLQGIIASTLIIWGTKDRFFPFAIARRLHRDIPHSSLVAVETAGHFLQEEEPELIAQKMAGFLTGSSGAP